MTVGTCAINPLPTTSPILAPSIRRKYARLHIAVEIERPGAAFAADARLAVAAERLPQIAHEEAVVPDQPGIDLRRDALGALLVAGHHHAGKAVFRVVGHDDRLRLGLERLQAEHRAEHFVAQNLGIV